MTSQKLMNFDPSSTLSHKLIPMLSKKLPLDPLCVTSFMNVPNVCHSDPMCMRNIKCSFGSTLLLKIIQDGFKNFFLLKVSELNQIHHILGTSLIVVTIFGILFSFKINFFRLQSTFDHTVSWSYQFLSLNFSSLVTLFSLVTWILRDLLACHVGSVLTG